MGISCDSFNDETNEQIGRYKRSSRGSFAHKDQAIQVAKWCATKGIMFKLNSVVNKWNCGEDMTEGLRREPPNPPEQISSNMAKHWKLG
eukprot:3730775-Amphidinium_carterae.1